MIVAGLVLALGGSLVVAVGRAARRGMLSRDAWTGIRTSETMSSDEAWYAAHEAGGQWISIGGWILTVGGLAILLVRPEDGDAFRIALYTTLAGAGAVIFAGFIGHRAAVAINDGDSE